MWKWIGFGLTLLIIVFIANLTWAEEIKVTPRMLDEFNKWALSVGLNSYNCMPHSQSYRQEDIASIGWRDKWVDYTSLEIRAYLSNPGTRQLWYQPTDGYIKDNSQSQFLCVLPVKEINLNNQDINRGIYNWYKNYYLKIK